MTWGFWWLLTLAYLNLLETERLCRGDGDDIYGIELKERPGQKSLYILVAIYIACAPCHACHKDSSIYA